MISNPAFPSLLAVEVGGIQSDSSHMLRQVDRRVLRGRVRSRGRRRTQPVAGKAHVQLAVRQVFNLDNYFCHVILFRIDVRIDLGGDIVLTITRR